MAKYPGSFSIAVHPGDILQEMLDERSASNAERAGAPLACLVKSSGCRSV